MSVRLPDIREALAALPHVTAQPPGRRVALGGREGRRVPGGAGGQLPGCQSVGWSNLSEQQLLS